MRTQDPILNQPETTRNQLDEPNEHLYVNRCYSILNLIQIDKNIKFIYFFKWGVEFEVQKKKIEVKHNKQKTASHHIGYVLNNVHLNVAVCTAFQDRPGALQEGKGKYNLKR